MRKAQKFLSTFFSTFFSTLAVIGLCSCGVSSNVNQIFNSKANESRFDVIMSKAQLLHDSGDYQSSLDELDKIFAVTNRSEAALQLKAFNELGLAGFSLFDLAIKISDQSSKLSESNDNSATQSIIQNLSSILDLDDATLENYGIKSDFTANAILSGLPIYIPRNPGSHENASDPRGSISLLKNLNKAIHSVCPLISSDLLAVEADHTMPRYQCEAFKGTIKNPSQAYFIFFLAHFAEALFFNVALLYSPETVALHLSSAQFEKSLFLKDATSEEQSNLFKRISALEKASKQTMTSFDELNDFTEALTEVSGNVQTVFNTSAGSLLYELMNNLKKTEGTIGKIAGLPSSFGEQITKAISNVDAVISKAGTQVNSLSSQTTALKDQLGFQIITKLDKQVSSYFDKVAALKKTNGGDLSACQKAQVAKMCDAVDKVFTDLSGVATPSDCKDYQTSGSSDTNTSDTCA